MPPLTEVDHFFQTEIVIEKLPLVNEQTGITSSFGNRFDDLIEGHDFVLEIRNEDAQGQKSTGERARHGDLNFRQIRRIKFFVGDNNRAIVIANRRSMRKQRVLVRDISVSMKADRGYVVSAFASFFIQGLNVFEH